MEEERFNYSTNDATRFVDELKDRVHELYDENKRLKKALTDINSQLNYLETYSSKEDVFDDMGRRLDRIDKIIGSESNE